MKFVLLGADPACLPLLRAIARAPQHDLAMVAQGDELWAQIAAAAPQARRAADWQALLVEPDVSAAIIAGFEPAVLEGARALARAGVPLVVFPDLRQTSAFVYQLWPIDEERRATLVPLLGTAAGDQWRAVRDGMRARAHVRFVEIERTGAIEPHAPIPLAIAEHHLLHDFDILRRLGGDYSRVTCVPVGLQDNSVARLEVTLSGDEVPEAIWNIAARPSETAATLEVVGGGPALGYLMPALSSHGLCDPHSTDADAEGELQLATAIARLSGSATEPRWSDLVKAFDVVDAARRSIRRRRTIEIGSEDISEVRQFKSLMTAAGCGVLLYTLFGVIAALLIGAVADPRDAAQRRAAAAAFIVHDHEFAPGTAELSGDGYSHVNDIAGRLWQTTADVIIEPASGSAATDVDAQRRAAVEETLRAARASNFAGRVVTRPVTGQWFEHLMIAVWIIVFLPLVLILALQLLRFAARRESNSVP